MAEGVRPEDYCDEPVEDEFGEIIKCRSAPSYNPEATLKYAARTFSSGSSLGMMMPKNRRCSFFTFSSHKDAHLTSTSL